MPIYHTVESSRKTTYDPKTHRYKTIIKYKSVPASKSSKSHNHSSSKNRQDEINKLNNIIQSDERAVTDNPEVKQAIAKEKQQAQAKLNQLNKQQQAENKAKSKILDNDQQYQVLKMSLRNTKPNTYARQEAQYELNKRKAELVGGSYTQPSVVINKRDNPKAFNYYSYEGTKARQEAQRAMQKTLAKTQENVLNKYHYKEKRAAEVMGEARDALDQNKQIGVENTKRQITRQATPYEKAILASTYASYSPNPNVKGLQGNKLNYFIGNNREVFSSVALKPQNKIQTTQKTIKPQNTYSEAENNNGILNDIDKYLSKKRTELDKNYNKNSFLWNVESEGITYAQGALSFIKGTKNNLDPRVAGVSALIGAGMSFLPEGKILSTLKIAGYAYIGSEALKGVRTIQTSNDRAYTVGSLTGKYTSEFGGFYVGSKIAEKPATYLLNKYSIRSPLLTEPKTTEKSFIKTETVAKSKSRFIIKGDTGEPQQMYLVEQEVPQSYSYVLKGKSKLGTPYKETIFGNKLGISSVVETKSGLGRKVLIEKSVTDNEYQLIYRKSNGKIIKKLSGEIQQSSNPTINLLSESNKGDNPLLQQENLYGKYIKRNYAQKNYEIIYNNRKVNLNLGSVSVSEQTAYTTPRYIGTKELSSVKINDDLTYSKEFRYNLLREDPNVKFETSTIKVPKGDSVSVSETKITATKEPRVLSTSNIKVRQIGTIEIVDNKPIPQENNIEVNNIYVSKLNSKPIFENTKAENLILKQEQDTKTDNVVHVKVISPSLKPVEPTYKFLSSGKTVNTNQAIGKKPLSVPTSFSNKQNPPNTIGASSYVSTNINNKFNPLSKQSTKFYQDSRSIQDVIYGQDSFSASSSKIQEALKIKVKTKQKVLPVVLSLQDQNQHTVSRAKVGLRTGQIQLQKPKTEQRTDQKPILKLVNVQKPKTEQVNKQRHEQNQDYKIKLESINKPIWDKPIDNPFNKKPEDEKPPEDKPPRLRFGDSKKFTTNNGGYIPEVRIKGEFVKASPIPLTEKQAFEIGKSRVQNTAAATFRIVPLGNNKVSSISFDTSKFYKKGNLYIEKNKERINTPGELREITKKGQLMNKLKATGKGLFATIGKNSINHVFTKKKNKEVKKKSPFDFKPKNIFK